MSSCFGSARSAPLNAIGIRFVNEKQNFPMTKQANREEFSHFSNRLSMRARMGARISVV
jgi:hypothetical protein